MRVYVCGVRGSTPAPGPDFVRYGGNTSCIALAHGDEPPRLVLDAGTGLQRLAGQFNGHAFRGTIILGHLHWDHTHGIPFFRAGDHPDAKVEVLIPAQGDAEEVLARAISPPHFPVRPSQLRGDWVFGGLEPGEYELEGFRVLAREIPHKGGRTFGFRVSDGSSSIAYLSDHGPIAVGPGPDGLGEYHEAARALIDGVDVLVHDAQHTTEEFHRLSHFGHSPIEYAVSLGEACRVGRVLLYHHDPSRTDDDLDAIVAQYADRKVEVEAAREGSVFDL